MGQCTARTPLRHSDDPGPAAWQAGEWPSSTPQPQRLGARFLECGGGSPSSGHFFFLFFLERWVSAVSLRLLVASFKSGIYCMCVLTL